MKSDGKKKIIGLKSAETRQNNVKKANRKKESERKKLELGVMPKGRRGSQKEKGTGGKKKGGKTRILSRQGRDVKKGSREPRTEERKKD